MIPEPFTEYNVLKETLRLSSLASHEVGQSYIITTYDLAGVMKAMPIIWLDPEAYRYVIILVGTFHMIMNYLNMIGHKMEGSGYSEILIEAALVTSGCLKSILNGKNFTKSL